MNTELSITFSAERQKTGVLRTHLETKYLTISQKKN